MNKRELLKAVNILLGILMLNQAFSGMFHDFLPRHLFHFLHKGGWVMVILTVVHIYLNWGWVKVNLLNRSGAKWNQKKGDPL